MNPTPYLARLLDVLNDKTGQPRISPIDPTVPAKAQQTRIAAHNMILSQARPFEHRICGYQPSAYNGPCVLKEGHADDRYPGTIEGHADAEILARAKRYLIHSEPNPDQRA